MSETKKKKLIMEIWKIIDISCVSDKKLSKYEVSTLGRIRTKNKEQRIYTQFYTH